MTIAVPRKRDAAVSGLERARIGRSAADARQGSARGIALEQARSDALRAITTPAGLARWCELAAANVDYSARVLLELVGQDARGPMRTRAWIMRNGARIAKGERGSAVSMFGGYVWSMRQSTGNFGGIGSAAWGDAPADVLAGYGEWADGDPIAAGILAAMRGYRVGQVDATGTVTADRLDMALARARGIAWNLPACLSCDGHGCVLCSCSDDRTRLKVSSVVVCKPMPAPRTTPKRIGRPPKTRPAIPAVSNAAKRAGKLRAEADRLMAETIRQAAAEGHTFGDVASAAGLTRQRVQQIVSGRSDRP